MSDFPRSVTQALKTSSDPVVYTRDDDLGQADAGCWPSRHNAWSPSGRPRSGRQNDE